MNEENTPTTTQSEAVGQQQACSALTADARAILRLTRENEALRDEIAEQKREMDSALAWMAAVGVPRGFEDGNSWDDYSFGERVGILSKMYQHASAQNVAGQATAKGEQ